MTLRETVALIGNVLVQIFAAIAEIFSSLRLKFPETFCRSLLFVLDRDTHFFRWGSKYVSDGQNLLRQNVPWNQWMWLSKSGGWNLLNAFPYSCALNYMHPCTPKSPPVLDFTATETAGEALLPSFWKAGCKPVHPHGTCIKPVGLVI